MILSAILGALFTFELIKKYEIHPIKSSTVTTLIYGIIFILLKNESYTYVFYGGSFIGMSRAKHFNYYQLIVSSFIFYAIYLYAIPFTGGLGGALGCSAFISVLFVRHIWRFGKKKLIILKKKE